VNLTDDGTFFNTSTFSGWEEPVTSVVLPLKDFRTLSVNERINIKIDVFRNVSNILPSGPME